MRGSVRADASLGGSRRQPEWRGTLHAGELALRSLIDGIDFSDGELDATLDGETLKLDRLRLRGAGGANGGLLLGSGLLRWSRPASAPGQPVAALEPALTLDLQAQTLRLLARADRRLMLSGKVAARLDGRRLDVSGRLQADQALFLLPDEDKPELGDDVVVRGQGQPARAQAAAPLQTRLRLELALGDNFHLRGQGLDTDLRGELLLSANPGQATPQLTGQIRTERGSFRAWGQALEIEAGVLSFNGPYDNPGLDILALRPLSGQRIGVQLSGNALAPRLRLHADPELPESEKLAWLVLGRPASGAGSEAALLQQAALALLSGRGRAADGGLTRALGLDELSLRGETQKADGSTSAAALTLGKRISRQLYLSYTRSMIGATGTVAVLYDLTRNFTVRAQAGDDNALDLIFTRQYDGGPIRKR
jgi:translocation and assembly module TamB